MLQRAGCQGGAERSMSHLLFHLLLLLFRRAVGAGATRGLGKKGRKRGGSARAAERGGSLSRAPKLLGERVLRLFCWPEACNRGEVSCG